MAQDYKPIDLREIKDKNRVSLSNDLLQILGEPDKIVFSKYELNGDTKIVVNNGDDVTIGTPIGKSVALETPKNRLTIIKPVLEEIGMNNTEETGKKFVGFFHVPNQSGGRVVELCRITASPIRNESEK